LLKKLEAFTPKSAKKYANIAEEIMKAMQAYVRDIKELKFPQDRHPYSMMEEEKEKLNKLIKLEK
jgi:3-methyl-2-oxobutanoate hydroxymethyltransferase